MKVAIVEYGVGNVFSLATSLKFLGIDSVITRDQKQLAEATHIFLPGVGAFGDAMLKLQEYDLVSDIKKLASDGKNIMGICLGMQVLFEKSEEYGCHEGLGLIEGEIVDMKKDLLGAGYSYKVPHMGWNNLIFEDSLQIKNEAQIDIRIQNKDNANPESEVQTKIKEQLDANPLIKGISPGDSVYFVHSYYAKYCEKSLIATSEYGIRIPAIVAKDNIYGCQFHPEKSGKVGLQILKAFVEL